MDNDTIQIFFLLGMFLLVPFYLIWWAKSHPQRLSARLNTLHGIPLENGFDYCLLSGEQVDTNQCWENVYLELYKNGNANARQMMLHEQKVTVPQLRNFELLLLDDGWQLFASPFEKDPFRLIYRRETGQAFHYPDPSSLPEEPVLKPSS